DGLLGGHVVCGADERRPLTPAHCAVDPSTDWYVDQCLGSFERSCSTSRGADCAGAWPPPPPAFGSAARAHPRSCRSAGCEERALEVWLSGTESVEEVACGGVDNVVEGVGVEQPTGEERGESLQGGEHHDRDASGITCHDRSCVLSV